MKEKRKPNWTLCVKDGEHWESIGAAWETEKGHLFLKLDEGETLQGTAMLFPYRERNKGGWLEPAPWKKKAPAPAPPPPPATGDYMEQKRRERQTPAVPTTPPNQDDDCPDHEGPGWL